MKRERKCLIAPSVLAADFSCAKDAVMAIEDNGAQWVHLDVMDGHFVPNMTFGPKFISDIRPYTTLPFDTHLMIEHPDRYIKEYAQAGSDVITVHAEASVHLHRTLCAIHEEGKQAGVSIVPSTPVSSIELILHEVELVLIMSVNPGFGGQKFIPFSLEKIRQLDRIRKERNLSFRISVDGGVNRDNGQELIDNGVDVLVMGSAFFLDKNPKELVHSLAGTAVQ